MNFIQRLPPVTRLLCGLLVVVSLVGAISQRSLGFGPEQLRFHVAVWHDLQLWRLITYPFVQSSPIALMMSLLVLWLLGRTLEDRWGSRDYARFFFLSSIGAGLIAIPCSYLINKLMPFYDLGVAEGPGPAIDAMLVAIALIEPDAHILFGFILPIRARAMVGILLAFEVISSIMTGASGLSLTLGGMGMGYVLTTGIWRPSRWIHEIKRFQSRRRRQRGLYVVPPRETNRRHWN